MIRRRDIQNDQGCNNLSLIGNDIIKVEVLEISSDSIIKVYYKPL